MLGFRPREDQVGLRDDRIPSPGRRTVAAQLCVLLGTFDRGQGDVDEVIKYHTEGRRKCLGP